MLRRGGALSRCACRYRLIARGPTRHGFSGDERPWVLAIAARPESGGGPWMTTSPSTRGPIFDLRQGDHPPAGVDNWLGHQSPERKTEAGIWARSGLSSLTTVALKRSLSSKKISPPPGRARSG